MIVDCISDLHGQQPALEGGDLLIVAGDLTARDTPEQHLHFAEWLRRQKYKKKVLIAGNHDGRYESVTVPGKTLYLPMPGCDYLFDSGTVLEGLKIWGSPWTPTFYNWHFMKDRGEPIKEKWDLIPDDIDILVTHGPPHGILDQVRFSSKAPIGKSAGCEELTQVLPRLKNLKLHVFGHVHEGYGQTTVNGVIYVNAAIMDENYNPVNKPIRIIL